MKLILDNIGLLQHAEISLRKLCVIADENDSGKSTIGKILFCIVKATNHYREDLQEHKGFRIQKKKEEIHLLLSEALRSTHHDRFDMLRGLRTSSHRHFLNTEDQLANLDGIIQPILALAELSSEDRQEVLALRDEIEVMLDQPEDLKQSIENAFKKAFASEFDGSVLLQDATEGRIQLIENDLTLIDLVVTNEHVRLMSEVEPVPLKDATFIDSPLILNHHDVLARSQTLLDIDQRRSREFSLGRMFTTLHTKDLFNKLRTQIRVPYPLSSSMSSVLADLKTLINGEVIYDRNERNFVFRRTNGACISIKNTASSIKVLGLLKHLIANKSVTNGTVLIFDEPENHLHPKWQLKLAEVLIKLAENGVYILVSSHSPHLIEALKRCADRGRLADKARFALAQNNQIQDEDRLSDIFSALTEPFEVFRKLDDEQCAQTTTSTTTE